jgi:hypothetical protein
MSFAGRLNRILTCAKLVRSAGVMVKRYESEILVLETEILSARDRMVDQGINFEDCIRGCEILSPEGDQQWTVLFYFVNRHLFDI